METAPQDVIVIGAGIIGVTAALELQAAGRQVRLLERDGVGAGASSGNAGAFAFPDILPLASPGIIRQAPRWLLDPLGPFAIRPSYALRIAPWLWRFWRASGKTNVRASTDAIAALMQLSEDRLRARIHDAGAGDMLRDEGQLQVYETDREWEASLPGWVARQQRDIPFEPLSGPGAIAEIQPGLSPRFRYGCFTPGWSNIDDPAKYLVHLAERFRQSGGIIETANVSGLRAQDGGCDVATDAGLRSARHVVVAAGAWSGALARQLGHRLPLETERGYNTTLPAGAFDLRTHVTFAGHGFVVSRIGEGIRVGGAVELGGLRLPPKFRRAQAMLQRAKAFLPELRTDGGSEWMGFRPSLPDSLPVIAPAPGHPGILYAFGHGHLGLTQSWGTATLITDLVLGRRPAIDLTPFRADRF